MAPTGTPTIAITCDCTVCNGRAALLRDHPDNRKLTGKRYATKRHNLVCAAHSPLARTRSGLASGPWAL